MIAEYYGLAAARRIVRNLFRNVKGETDSFAKGYRSALRDADRTLEKLLKEMEPADK